VPEIKMQLLELAGKRQLTGVQVKVTPGGSPERLFNVTSVRGMPMTELPSETVIVCEYGSPSQPDASTVGHTNCAGVQPVSGVQVWEFAIRQRVKGRAQQSNFFMTQEFSGKFTQ